MPDGYAHGRPGAGPRTDWPRSRSLPALTGLLVSLGLCASAHGQGVDVHVYVDLDGAASTGCTVSTAAGPFAGAESVVTTTVDPSSMLVASAVRRECQAATGTFGDPVPLTAPFAPPWPVGVGLGTDGTDVVETYLPALFSPTAGAEVRLAVTTVDGAGREDALPSTAPFDVWGKRWEVPVLSPASLLGLGGLLAVAGSLLLRRRRVGTSRAVGLAFLVAGISGIALAAGGGPDGDPSEWTAGDLVASKPPVADPPYAEIRQLRARYDGFDLHFRVDVGLCHEISVTSTSLADGLAGVAYSPTVTFTEVGGTGAATWTATGLPPGMSVAAATGELSGTSTQTGSFTVAVTATDVQGCRGSASIPFTVRCPAIALVPASGALSPATEGMPYSQLLTAAPGGPAWTFELTDGALPDGMALGGSSGLLAGTTADPGDYAFEVTATDAVTGCGGAAGYTLSVVAVDDPPVAVGDVPTVGEDSGANVLGVLANDTDVDGGPISITSVTQPANGTVAITGGGTGLTYTPSSNYCNDPPGTALDTFTYTLSPGGSSATVGVRVTCVADPP